MKIFRFTFYFVLCTLYLSLNSCTKDKDASAKVYYTMTVSRISFDDTADEAYQQEIVEALQSLELCGDPSTFSVAKTDNNIERVYAQCDQEAQAIFKQRLKELTSTALRDAIYEQSASVYTSLGITSAAELPLGNFRIEFWLYNTMYQQVIGQEIVAF